MNQPDALPDAFDDAVAVAAQLRTWLLPLLVAFLAVTLLVLLVVLARRRKARPRPAHGTAPRGVPGFYLVAVMSMAVSVDTSWRFFTTDLHITDVRERVVMFAVLEVAFIACGYGMRANVRAHGRPGAPRLVAWALCGMAAYMAWQLSGVAEGLARVALGPVLGLVMLHLALGIEIRAGHARSTAWARVGHEVRERLLSRMGLADDTRDALARTRERAVQRAARLALADPKVLWREARLHRALRTARVADDPAARARLLAEIATARHAGGLAELPMESPWLEPAVPASPEPATRKRRSTRPGTVRRNRASSGDHRAPAKPSSATSAMPVPAASSGDGTEAGTEAGTELSTGTGTPVPDASTRLHVVHTADPGTDGSAAGQWDPELWQRAVGTAREYRAANGSDARVDDFQALGIRRAIAAELRRAVLASGEVGTDASTDPEPGADRATQ